MMTGLKMVFVGFILVWFGISFLGLMQMDAYKVPWGAIVFFGTIPFIPVVAWLCGL